MLSIALLETFLFLSLDVSYVGLDGLSHPLYLDAVTMHVESFHLSLLWFYPIWFWYELQFLLAFSLWRIVHAIELHMYFALNSVCLIYLADASLNHKIIPLQPLLVEMKQDTSQIDGPSPKNVFGFEFSPSGSGKENRMQASQVWKCEFMVNAIDIYNYTVYRCYLWNESCPICCVVVVFLHVLSLWLISWIFETNLHLKAKKELSLLLFGRSM